MYQNQDNMKVFRNIGIGLVGLIILVGLCVYLFGTVDLRTETAKKNPSESKAIFLIEEMAKAHQVENWKDVSTYTVQFQEEMFGLIGKSSNPFPEAKSQFELSYIPDTYDGKLTFSNGAKAGETWGIQSWQTYTSKNDEAPVFKNDKDIFFWIPTYQYFIEFPLRIMNANAFGYAGKKEVNGIACDGVIASWNTIAPQRKTDQYLIWLDSKTHRIVKLEYTVRDMFNFITGAVSYKNYKDFDGILLATVMPGESNLLSKGALLHQMEILSFEKNTLAPGEMRPNLNLKVLGDEK